MRRKLCDCWAQAGFRRFCVPRLLPSRAPDASLSPNIGPTKQATVMQQLEPSLVWRHFATLCSIPRPSKQEAALRQALADWAVERGLETLVEDRKSTPLNSSHS